VKQVMRHLTLVAALTSSICGSAPNSFATDAMSVKANATPIAPVVDVRAASANQEAFFSKVFTVAMSNGRDIIPETLKGRGEVRFDDKNSAKIASRMSTDPIHIGLRDTHSSTLWFVNGQTESRARHVTCRYDTSALLRPVYPRSPVPKPKELRVTLHYDKLALQFTLAPKRVYSLCTLVSQRAALPVIADVRAGRGAGLIDTSQQVAASVTTATLDIIPTRTDVRRCDFSLMRSLTRPELGDPAKPLPSGTNECYLNEPGSSAINGLTARWSIPGFEEYTPDERGAQVYKTRALTYYTDLNSLLATKDVSLIDSIVVDCLENYIHQTIIKNLPAITPIGLAHVVLGT
jgi:hypothetical protein